MKTVSLFNCWNTNDFIKSLSDVSHRMKHLITLLIKVSLGRAELKKNSH